MSKTGLARAERLDRLFDRGPDRRERRSRLDDKRLLDLVHVRWHVNHQGAGIADVARPDVAGHADNLQRLLRILNR
jgi:hypothetical protein